MWIYQFIRSPQAVYDQSDIDRKIQTSNSAGCWVASFKASVQEAPPRVSKYSW